MSILDFTSDSIPTDELMNDAPPSEQALADGLICASCGKVFEHTGRGRKPKQCPECRAAKTPRTATKRGSGDTAAAMAVIESFYDIATVGLLMVSPKAAAQWNEKTASLLNTDKLAFDADKNLARTVARMGERTGKGMFFAAHVMAIAPVVVTLTNDIRSRRAEKEAESTVETYSATDQPVAQNPNQKFFG